ncbi:unnamed protein product [Camellia sinensis]
MGVRLQAFFGVTTFGGVDARLWTLFRWVRVMGASFWVLYGCSATLGWYRGGVGVTSTRQSRVFIGGCSIGGVARGCVLAVLEVFVIVGVCSDVGN